MKKITRLALVATAVAEEEEKEKNMIQIVSPYHGTKSEAVMKLLTNTNNKTLPNTTIWVIFKRTRLSIKFNIKDREKIENIYDIVNKAKCPDCPQSTGSDTSVESTRSFLH